MTTGGSEGKWDGWSSGKHREEILILGTHSPLTTGLKDFLTMAKWQVLPFVVLKVPQKNKK